MKSQQIIAIIYRHIDDLDKASKISQAYNFAAYADEEMARGLRQTKEADLREISLNSTVDEIYQALKFFGPTISEKYLSNGMADTSGDYNNLTLAALKMGNPDISAEALQEKLESLHSMEVQNTGHLINAPFRAVAREVLGVATLRPETIPDDVRIFKHLLNDPLKARDPNDQPYDTAFRFFDAAVKEYESVQRQPDSAQEIKIAGYLAVACRMLGGSDDVFKSRLWGKVQDTGLHQLLQQPIDFLSKHAAVFSHEISRFTTYQRQFDTYGESTPIFRDPVPYVEEMLSRNPDGVLEAAAAISASENTVSFFSRPENAHYNKPLPV